MRISSLLLLLSLLLLTACQPMNRERFLDEFDELIAKIKRDQYRYDEAGWQEKEAELTSLLNEHYAEVEPELTAEDKVYIWAETAGFFVQRYGDQWITYLRTHQDEYLDLMEEHLVKSAAFTGRLLEEMRPELERLGPEINRLGQDFLRRLEESGTLDRLKQKLEEVEAEMERR
jgi:hypothetical protein